MIVMDPPQSVENPHKVVEEETAVGEGDTRHFIYLQVVVEDRRVSGGIERDA